MIIVLLTLAGLIILLVGFGIGHFTSWRQCNKDIQNMIDSWYRDTKGR